jgi:hypothetical protein
MSADPPRWAVRVHCGTRVTYGRDFFGQTGGWGFDVHVSAAPCPAPRGVESAQAVVVEGRSTTIGSLRDMEVVPALVLPCGTELPGVIEGSSTVSVVDRPQWDLGDPSRCKVKVRVWELSQHHDRKLWERASRRGGGGRCLALHAHLGV